MLTEEEEKWLLDQIAEEEGADEFANQLEAECDPESVVPQGITADGGQLDSRMEQEMLHFLNSTGQEPEWVENPMAVEERKADADGTYYTRAEFIDFYGGTAQWDMAPPEKRMDEGNPYTIEGFVEYYGTNAASKWQDARPQAACTHFRAGSCRAGNTCKYLHLTVGPVQ
eukprot:TRINITY_DN4792_c0_g1_i1.p1 TRINITY_DN4792_c0_g1~~TRINITY_DN4792_c0_g1_i1.p1  ORF type:complete len:170 (+),score=29.49 TRINITY_DN4792_c0_g1_i1:44-553(+)